MTGCAHFERSRAGFPQPGMVLVLNYAADVLLDWVQIAALVTVIAGLWVALLVRGPIGVGLVLTALIVFAAALWVEHEVDGGGE